MLEGSLSKGSAGGVKVDGVIPNKILDLGDP